MNAYEVIARFCALQAKVSEHIGFSYASDCFCRDRSRGGLSAPIDDESYRNDGKALEWIEAVVDEAIKNRGSGEWITRPDARSAGGGE